MDLKDLTLLAQGGQAEVYMYGADKVVRVLRNPQDEALLLNEIEIMRALKSTDVCVPEVFEYLEVDGRPAVVVERIAGDSMLAYIKRHPFKMWEEAGKLATLHLAVAKNGLVQNLKPSKERARFLIGRADLLKPDIKEFVFGLIDDLPEGDALCHGDFHPGNILKAGNRDYIIDWFGAYRGDVLSDAAHTYLILRNVPGFPGMGTFQHAVIRFSGRLISGSYLAAFRRQRPFDFAQFSKWLVVKAAERVFYGMPTEKQGLIRFIESCFRSQDGPGLWYKSI